MYYTEDYWMTDTPYRRVFALTYCEECDQKYMIRQWEPKLQTWCPTPEGVIYWRPLEQPPSNQSNNLCKWIAIKDK